MGLFKRIKDWKQSRFANSRSIKPVTLERLEPRILLSADGLLALEAADQEFSSYVVIEQTELVLYELNTVESDSFTLELNGQGLQFNLIAEDGMSQEAIDAFQEAADIFSGLFTDDIIVNIKINFTELSSGVLGTSSFSLQLDSYTDVYTALMNDANGSSDDTATASLSSDSDISIYINLTSNNPKGSSSITPYLDDDSDANNTVISLTTANAKALGLLSADNSAKDATITLNSSYTWDLDRSDGIDSGAFDFVGIALHEIGHALGFASGVD